MKRRDFITLLGGAVAAWPLAARAQQTSMSVIGYLNSGSRDVGAPALQAFRRGLGELGYVEGQNVAIEYRWAEGQFDRLRALADDLVRGRVIVIAATGAVESAEQAKSATATFPIPVVFYYGQDPVRSGLIASLNRPGGNLTGVATLGAELGPKRLELLHELLPSARAILMLVAADNPNAEALQVAARSLGVQSHFLPTANDHDFDAAFRRLAELRADGLWIGGVFGSGSKQLAALTLRHAVPAISPSREFAAAGGLMSYSASPTDAYRLIGHYAGRILKGEKPANLPVQQPTKIDLTINLKTAKALGITVPRQLLIGADELIE